MSAVTVWLLKSNYAFALNDKNPCPKAISNSIANLDLLFFFTCNHLLPIHSHPTS